jgi:hypothetical protein
MLSVCGHIAVLGAPQMPLRETTPTWHVEHHLLLAEAHAGKQLS